MPNPFIHEQTVARLKIEHLVLHAHLGAARHHEVDVLAAGMGVPVGPTPLLHLGDVELALRVPGGRRLHEHPGVGVHVQRRHDRCDVAALDQNSRFVHSIPPTRDR